MGALNWLAGRNKTVSLKRFFVTGAQGFVGRYLVAHLLHSNPQAQIFGIGRSAPQSKSFTHPIRWNGRAVPAPIPMQFRSDLDQRYQYRTLDVHDRPGLAKALRAFEPDAIIHLASGLREDPPGRLFRTNVEGTIDLLEVLRELALPVKSVILGSTGGVYGAQAILPINEEAPCNPLDYYSISKLAAEQASWVLARHRGLPIIQARMFNLVGPGQAERHVCGHFVSQALPIAEGLARPVIEAESLDTTRDFIDVRDVASALVLVAQLGTPGSAYNIASGHEVAIRTILNSVLQAAGLEGRVRIRQSYRRASDIPRHFASIDRLRSLRFECRYPLQESIADVLAYYQNDVRLTQQDKRAGFSDAGSLAEPGCTPR
jgi:GDP-4-dehydro-6-deoxy-D-mannose reductase